MGEPKRGDDGADERLLEAIERLEKVIGRFCVLGERLLASNDSAAKRSGKVADEALRAGVQVSQSARERVRRKLSGAGR